jgi:hypothetical protein
VKRNIRRWRSRFQTSMSSRTGISALTEGAIANNRMAASRWLIAAVWLIAVSLAVIAACLLQGMDSRRSQAFAQPAMSGGARGVFAFSGQLSKDSYGVFMVDVDVGTLWCYRFTGAKNTLNLVAVRDWRYDRYLEQWATDPPIEVIKAQVEQLRAAARTGSSPPPTPAPSATP